MRRKRALMSALTAVAVIASLTPTAASASTTSSREVRNTGDIAIGAIQTWLGYGDLYIRGPYDDLIPAHQYSGYPSTAAIYVGSGYCVRRREWTNAVGTELSPTASITRGPYQLILTAKYGIDVRALPIGNSGCDY
jgi:hypothetical protein